MSPDNKVKIVKVFDVITLEAAAVDTQADADRVLVDTYFSQKLNLTCKYTTGAGETSNACDITVYGYDGTNWIPLGVDTITAGVSEFTPTIYRIAGAAAETEYQASFSEDITFTKLKVTAVETGVVTNKGTLTAVALVQ